MIDDTRIYFYFNIIIVKFQDQSICLAQKWNEVVRSISKMDGDGDENMVNNWTGFICRVQLRNSENGSKRKIASG